MSLTLDQARQIADASLARGRELGLKPLTVCVLDARASTKARSALRGASA